MKIYDEIGKDKNYYNFSEIEENKGEGFLSASKLKGKINQITINYSKGETELKAHELKHGVDIARGISTPEYIGLFSNYTESFKMPISHKSEVGAYMLQYFFNSSSLPVMISNHKEILNWEELRIRLNTAVGEELYGK